MKVDVLSEYTERDFVIEHLSAFARDACAVCGEPAYGLRSGAPAVVLRDFSEPVCPTCANEHAPVLLACLHAFQAEYEPPFGACPECGQDLVGFHVGKTNWFVCFEDKVRSCAGSGLISIPHDETEEVWEQRARELAGYRDVEPLHRAEDVLSVRKKRTEESEEGFDDIPF